MKKKHKKKFESMHRIAKGKTFAMSMTERDWSNFRRKYGYKNIGSDNHYYSVRVSHQLHDYAVVKWAKANSGWIAQQTNQSQKQVKRGKLSKESYQLASSKLEHPMWIIKKVGEVHFEIREEFFRFMKEYTHRKMICGVLHLRYRIVRRSKKGKFLGYGPIEDKHYSSSFFLNQKHDRSVVIMNIAFDFEDRFGESVEFLLIDREYILRIDWGYKKEYQKNKKKYQWPKR